MLDCLAHPLDHTKLDRLIDRTRVFKNELLGALAEGRDRLLERSSFNEKHADDVVATIGNATQALKLGDYMEALFDEFGVEQHPHSPHTVTLHPSEQMICESFPSLPEDGTTATYQRFHALSREDIQFLTWEHPMISGAMDMLLAGEYGNTGFCTLKLSAAQPGTLIVETIFSLQCAAPKGLQLGRFLPLSMLRIVTDGKRLLGDVLSEERLVQLTERVPLRSAQTLVRHARARIARLIEQAKSAAESQLAPIVVAANDRMTQHESHELERLKELAKVNPNIRDREIQHAKSTIETLHRSLLATKIKLEGVRVILVT